MQQLSGFKTFLNVYSINTSVHLSASIELFLFSIHYNQDCPHALYRNLKPLYEGLKR